jgi:hypothetical protein
MGQMKHGREITRSIGTANFNNGMPCIAQTGGVVAFFAHWAAIVVLFWHEG